MPKLLQLFQRELLLILKTSLIIIRSDNKSEIVIIGLDSTNRGDLYIIIPCSRILKIIIVKLVKPKIGETPEILLRLRDERQLHWVKLVFGIYIAPRGCI